MPTRLTIDRQHCAARVDNHRMSVPALPPLAISVLRRAAAAVALVALVAGCRGASAYPPQSSPSGEYELRVVDGWTDGVLELGVEVTDREGAVLFGPPHRWGAHHRFERAWGERDSVWVYSSDYSRSWVWVRDGADGWRSPTDAEMDALDPPGPIFRSPMPAGALSIPGSH
jgi:hypothetical protein